MYTRNHLSHTASKRYSLGVRISLILLILVAPAISAAPRPNNPNAQKAIDAAIRSVAGKPEDIDLTTADRLKIIQLGLAGKGISDLTPLGNLVNLKHLWVHKNQLRELTGITQLKNLESQK